jgi:bifunctional hydroxylase/dehydrase
MVTGEKSGAEVEIGLDADVIVVGAGPVGLMLAAELRLAGVEVVVLERLPEPSGYSRGFVVHARTREVLDQRGILDRFADVPVLPGWHFGALPVQLDLERLDGAHAGMMLVPQARTEQVLAEWAEGLGAAVRRGHEAVDLLQTPDRVEVQVRGPGGASRLRAGYVVGCDGSRSLVRRAAGFDFPSEGSAADVLMADVEGLELQPRPFTWTPAGLFAVVPLGAGLLRLVVHEQGSRIAEEAAPPAFEELRAAFARVTGLDVAGARTRWLTRFGDRSGQVTRYRAGRVLLAGDAAHVHWPGGGQGLNLGVQDALNLGWKLAAEVHGWAPADLLDTYHAERHPVGESVLRNTRAQAVLMTGGAEIAPLRELLAGLLELEDVNRELAGQVSAVDVRYDVGGGDHRLVGRRMPQAELVVDEVPTTTTRLLRMARGVLLDLAGGPAVRAAGARWAGRIEVVAGRPAGADLDGVDAVLLRPDGHVAWAAPSAGGPDLETALARWFGAPAPA